MKMLRLGPPNPNLDRSLRSSRRGQPARLQLEIAESVEEESAGKTNQGDLRVLLSELLSWAA